MQQSRNFTAGVLFLVMGLIFLITGWDYPNGSMRRMGPGMFPMLVSIVLMGCSLALIIGSLGRIKAEWFSLAAMRAQARPVLAILLAVSSFGLLIEDAGVILAVFVMIMISYLAGDRRRLLPALAGAVALSAIIAVIFIQVLNIPMKVLP